MQYTIYNNEGRLELWSEQYQILVWERGSAGCSLIPTLCLGIHITDPDS
jgi:hypothetical protein